MNSNPSTQYHSLYIHIPFCTHRCAYCDFNTYAGQERLIPEYVDALCREIEFVGRSRSEPLRLRTVFFGGGTPSLLAPQQFDSVLSTIRLNSSLATDAEITMEANPDTVSHEHLRHVRSLGVNRISFGVQSANHEELRMLERQHDFFTVIDAVSSARRAGFDNLNLDLIFGMPEQTIQTWRTTVHRILEFRPEHISAYALTLEHGTPFGRWTARGLLPIPDPDLAADMYEWASGVFERAGYQQYEISNWALPGRECRHNLQYWRGLPYLGVGAGAHGYANGYRYSNVLRIKTYIERLGDVRSSMINPAGGERVFPLTPSTGNHHRQSLDEDMADAMITGLRLTREGIAKEDFRHRFERELMDVYGKEIDSLTRRGLLEWTQAISEAGGTSEILRLTVRGRLVGNQAFMSFVS